MGKTIFCLGVLLFFAAVPSASAENISDLKAQLSEMQKQLAQMQTRIQELENAQTGMSIASQQTQVLLESVQPSVTVGAYVNTQFENFQGSDSRFTNHKIELILDASLQERLKLFSEIEIEEGAAIGEDRGGELVVEQAYVDYKIADQLSLRSGVVIVPFGQYNEHHFNVEQELVSVPLVDRRIIPTDWSELGAGVHGSYDLDNLSNLFKQSSVDYELYFVNGLTDKITDNGLRNARGKFGSDNNNSKALVGRLAFSPRPMQEVGVSAYFGDYDKKSHSINGFSTDWHFEYQNFELLGEYALFDLEKGLNNDDLLVPNQLQGIYVEGQYHFWPQFLKETFLGKSFEDPTFTAVVRYGWAEIKDDGDLNIGNNEEDRWSFGLSYRPTQSFVFKFEYQINDTKNEALEKGGSNGFLAAIAAQF